MKRKESKKPGTRDTAVSWNESLHVNRGQEAESDEIQEVVRHHRKDTEHDLHDEHPGEHDAEREEQRKKSGDSSQAA